MKTNPVKGDRWTRPGEKELKVCAIEGDMVRMCKGGTAFFSMTLDEYRTHAAACLRKGDTLHRIEEPEPYFE